MEIKKWLHKHHLPELPHQDLITAFTHPSYKGMSETTQDYERLEFLGDAVLDLIVADILYSQTLANHLSEGELTEQRVLLVNNHSLAEIFALLEMEEVIRTAKHYQLSIKDRANFVESFFGAIFFSKGYDFTKTLWLDLQKTKTSLSRTREKQPLVDDNSEEKKELLQYYHSLDLRPKNPKSILQELCQKQNMAIPHYEVTQQAGQDHAPEFTVKIVGNFLNIQPERRFEAIGKGSSKKIAELNAAQAICDEIFLPYI